jgi:hypothetical protein
VRTHAGVSELAACHGKLNMYLVSQDQLAVGCYDGVLSHWQLQQLAIECLQLDWPSSQGCAGSSKAKK